MKRHHLIVLCGIVIALGCVQVSHAQPTVYIVRHAEKIETWLGGILDAYHPLSGQGVARAESLAVVFEPGAIDAIYSSRTTRTLHTALPLSQKLGLPISEAKACQDTSYIVEFYAELERYYRQGQAVMLVSHSDVIPYLLIMAGVPQECWERLGITGTPGVELLIEGYAGLWRIELPVSAKEGCEGFNRQEFWPMRPAADAEKEPQEPGMEGESEN